MAVVSGLAGLYTIAIVFFDLVFMPGLAHLLPPFSPWLLHQAKAQEMLHERYLHSTPSRAASFPSWQLPSLHQREQCSRGTRQTSFHASFVLGAAYHFQQKG